MGCRVGSPESFRLGKCSLVAHTYLKVKGLLEVTRFEVQMTAEVEVGKQVEMFASGNVRERQFTGPPGLMKAPPGS